MFNLERYIRYIGRSIVRVVPWELLLWIPLAILAILSGLKVVQLQWVPVLLSIVLVWLVQMVVIKRHMGARFIKALYGLKNIAQAEAFLNVQLYGRSGFRPYRIIGEGKDLFGEEVVREIGGPGGLVVRNDTAVVLEGKGKLSRVIRGPNFPSLAPFEKIWDVIDLRPQRWVFDVGAITHDGIPINYEADVQFQVGDTEDDVFKVATWKWIREAWRTEPDRLMDWTKRVVIGDTEGNLRSILARYTLDQLIDSSSRQAVQDELHKALSNSVTKMGVKLLNVALVDIKFKEGQVVQQWIDTWRAERLKERHKTIMEGTVERTRNLEKARAEVRKRMLDETAQVFEEMAARGQQVQSKLVALSFIEMLKRTALEQSYYSPENMLKTLDVLQHKIEKNSSDGSGSTHPPN